MFIRITNIKIKMRNLSFMFFVQKSINDVNQILKKYCDLNFGEISSNFTTTAYRLYYGVKVVPTALPAEHTWHVTTCNQSRAMGTFMIISAYEEQPNVACTGLRTLINSLVSAAQSARFRGYNRLQARDRPCCPLGFPRS